LKNRLDVFRSVKVESLDSVIPAWSAGIQADTDVSGASLRTWVPAIHAGMTKIFIFILCGRAQANETLRGESFSTQNPEEPKILYLQAAQKGSEARRLQSRQSRIDNRGSMIAIFYRLSSILNRYAFFSGLLENPLYDR
jgi:hypothetical protein